MLDVESVSLHGRAFAVGAIVVNKRTGVIIDQFQLKCTEIMPAANEWVKANVIPVLVDMPECEHAPEFRERFWLFYKKYCDNSDVWGDCIFPVETNFLSWIAKDDLPNREFMMPYPLNDLAAMVNISKNRIEECGESMSWLRPHHPIDDCIASTTLLLAMVYNISLKLEAPKQEINSTNQ